MEKYKEMGRKEEKNRTGSLGQSAVERDRAEGVKTLDEWCKRKRELSGEELEGGDGATNKKMQKLMDGEREGAMNDQENIILKEIRELRMEARSDRVELKGGMEEIRKEIEEVKREMRWKEERWEKERRELVERIGRLEGSIGERQEVGREEIKRLEVRVEKLEKERGRKVSNKDEGEVEGRVRRMEWILEREEREKRKRNLVFKGVRTEKGKAREAILELCKEMGIRKEVEIEEMRGVKTGREERGEMIIIKVRSEDDKRRILENKGRLKGKNVWVEEDLTFKERKMKWNLRKIREEEIKRGKVVKLGYGKIMIGNIWWYWDEEENILRDGRGRRREEGEKGEERRGR